MIRIIYRNLNKKRLVEKKWDWHFAFFHFKDYKNAYLNGKPLKPWHILKNGDVVEIFERPVGIFSTIGLAVIGLIAGSAAAASASAALAVTVGVLTVGLGVAAVGFGA